MILRVNIFPRCSIHAIHASACINKNIPNAYRKVFHTWIIWVWSWRKYDSQSRINRKFTNNYSQILSATNDCTVDIVILLSCEYFPKPFFNHFGRLPKIQATHFGRLTCPGDYPYLPNPLQKSPPAVLSPWLPPGSSPSANHSEARKSWSLQWLLDSLP